MKILVLIALLLVPITFFAQTVKPAPEFNGVKVDSTLDYVVKQYVAKGFTISKKFDDKSVITLKGALGTDAIEVFVIATPSTHKVWKVSVYFPKEETWSSLKNKFSSIKGLLTNKYGEPDKDYHFFSSPYEEGDGYEMTAVAVDKCGYFTYWRKNLVNATIMTKISEYKQVNVTYQNQANSELNDTEKNKATSDGL